VISRSQFSHRVKQCHWAADVGIVQTSAIPLQRPTRRTVLAAAAATVVGAAAGSAAGTVRSPASADTAPNGGRGPSRRSRKAQLTPLHVLRRCTYGPTPESLAEIRSIGVQAWFNRQLSPSTIVDTQCDGVIARYPKLRYSISEVHAAADAGTFQRFSWELMFQLGQTALVRAAWSKRQLFEVMVDFWANHLNITNPFDGGWDNRHAFDRDVIRRHTFGTFREMLRASAVHPAMVTYLDQKSSTKSHPNENYARELMELHTVGVNAGYTETHVLAAARLLTGMTVQWDTGQYKYDSAKHAVGPVSILGFSSANSSTYGEPVAFAFIDYLARHPATARRIATKLAVRFVSDTPPAALIDRLARVYTANDTAILPVLRTLFGSAEFAASAGAKLRRPMEDLVATIRILGLQPDVVTSENPTGTWGIQGFYWMVGGTGNSPMGWTLPDGYPDAAHAWASPASVLARWNAHSSLAAHWWPTEISLPGTAPWHERLRTALVPTLPATWGGLIDALCLRLVHTRVSPEHRAALLAYFSKSATDPVVTTDWRLGNISMAVSAILSSPYFSFR